MSVSMDPNIPLQLVAFETENTAPNESLSQPILMFSGTDDAHA